MVHLKPDVVLDIPVQGFYDFVWSSMPDSQLSKPAYIDGLTGETLTYGQLREDALAFGRGLRDPKSPWGGLKRGEIACMFGPNDIRLPAIIFGLMGAGGGLSPSNPNYTVRELVHQLKSSGSTLLISHSTCLGPAKEAAAEAGLPDSRLILMDEGVPGYPTVKGITERGKQLTDADVGGKVVLTEREIKEVPSLVPYSSGTTGLPKGVALSQYNLVANVLQFMYLRDPNEPPAESDYRPCFLPLFHMNGLMQFLCMAPKMGATTVVYPRFDLKIALEAWSKYKTKTISLVPPLAVVLAKTDLSGYDLSAVEGIGCGAAPLGGEVEDILIEKFGVPVKQGYGCSEGTCGALLYRHNTPYKRGSVGVPLPNLEVKVVDPETLEPVGYNKEGELWIRGPNVALGYVNNPEATRGSWTEDGFYKTGDLVSCDEDRQFWIRDRLKELIKYNAFQIAPAELEDLLLRHKDVADSCVIGMPSEEHGEVPRAFVVLKPGVEATKAKEDEVRAFLDGLVSPLKRLRGGVEFVPAIPRNPSGKILRRQIRDEVRARAEAAKAKAKL
ncbi:phenylacetyl-CoA ligase [Hyaloraphidium curvatum]|nr:phenylacetyl-CoA ligase [Hyaloraphidium curvatum]